MTIFKNNVSEKKDDNDLPSPEVVTDSMLLIENEKNEANHLVLQPYQPDNVQMVNSRTRRTNRFGAFHICIALIIVPLGLIVLTGCIWLYKHLQENEEIHYIGRCGVDFHQMPRIDPMLPLMGKFEQEIMIENRMFERIRVPRIGDTKQATILHDFNMNWTVIVDKEMDYCFIMSLDRSLVLPPTDLWDLLYKLKSGYFLLDAEILRANYRAITPPVSDWSLYGPHIQKECAMYETFRLAKEGEPVALSKRSACNFAGEKYCLGDAGYDKMLCLRITGCY